MTHHKTDTSIPTWAGRAPLRWSLVFVVIVLVAVFGIPAVI